MGYLMYKMMILSFTMIIMFLTVVAISCLATVCKYGGYKYENFGWLTISMLGIVGVLAIL
jgi:hypothetical protein